MRASETDGMDIILMSIRSKSLMSGKSKIKWPRNKRQS